MEAKFDLKKDIHVHVVLFKVVSVFKKKRTV